MRTSCPLAARQALYTQLAARVWDPALLLVPAGVAA